MIILALSILYFAYMHLVTCKMGYLIVAALLTIAFILDCGLDHIANCIKNLKK